MCGVEMEKDQIQAKKLSRGEIAQIGAIGEIAQIQAKKLASGDKGIRVTIDLNAYPGLLGALDSIWNTERGIKLLIWQGE